MPVQNKEKNICYDYVLSKTIYDFQNNDINEELMNKVNKLLNNKNTEENNFLKFEFRKTLMKIFKNNSIKIDDDLRELRENLEALQKELKNMKKGMEYTKYKTLITRYKLSIDILDGTINKLNSVFNELPLLNELPLPLINKNTVITYTWCECGENHFGNQQIGEIAKQGYGFNKVDLDKAKVYFETNYGSKTEIYNLKKMGLVDDRGNELVITDKNDKVVKVNDAYLLIVRNLIPLFLEKNNLTMDDLMKEVTGKYWDSKYWDSRRRKVLNKHARKNNVIAEKEQTANYSKGEGTVHSFKSMPIMNMLKKDFKKIGEKFDFPVSEGNFYEDRGVKKTGIGWHGDSERRRVLSMRLGMNPSMPFYYRWKYKHAEIGKIMKWDINAGDVMIMSEWAVGTEWKKSSLVTLVHATGAAKYVKPKSG